MALMALTSLAQNTGDYIYVYHHSGQTDGFLREEIKELYYSYEDTLGVTHDELASQCIALEDSVYMIPLADIDSISFVTPQTVYQPGVVRIDEGLMDYVLGSDSLTILIDKNVPESLLPKIGDKLATTVMNDKFPAGFAGKVSFSALTGAMYTVLCDAVDLEEIFKSYYSVTIAESVSEEAAEARKAATRAFDVNLNPRVDFKLPSYKVSLGAEYSRTNLPFLGAAKKYGTKFDVSLKPEITAKTTLIINEKQGTVIDVSITSIFDVDLALSFYGGQEKPFYVGLEVAKQPLCPLVYLYLKPGTFKRQEKLASLSVTRQDKFTSTFSYSYCSKSTDNKPPKLTGSHTSSAPQFEGCLESRIEYGVFAEVGITVLHSALDNISYRGELGAELVGKLVVTEDDIKKAQASTALYDILKNTSIELNTFTNYSFQSKDPFQTITPVYVRQTNPMAKYDLVPKFSNMEFVESSGSGQAVTADASATVSGKCMVPMTVGFIVSDKDGNHVDNWNANDKHKSEEQTINTTFDKLKDGETYVLNPKVVLFDFDILATPATNLEKDKFPVRITDFKQSDARYSKKQEFEYEGRYYYYKYNAITTVEVDQDAQKVKDWGYVYHDIYGVDKKISCANLGSNPYPDARYAYYYNERSRTVSLTPYIQYEGETDIKRGKEKIYRVEYVYSGMSSCPDEHHPHAIDLGLPSGTLWACCNVGAEEPEGFGAYYQSGNPGNGLPAFQGNDDTYEFAGTGFDPATVEWGVEWATPSSDQMDELIQYSTYEDKYEMRVIDGSRFIFPKEPGGDAYVKVYGPNGNYILLPAAGIKNADGTYKDKNQPAYQHQDGALKGDWRYNGSYWTDYNDGKYAVFLMFSESFFKDRSLQKNQENEVDFDTVASKDLTQAMPIRPVINKNQGGNKE